MDGGGLEVCRFDMSRRARIDSEVTLLNRFTLGVLGALTVASFVVFVTTSGTLHLTSIAVLVISSLSVNILSAYFRKNKQG